MPTTYLPPRIRLDLYLREMRGFDFLAALKADPGCAASPSVVMTSYKP